MCYDNLSRKKHIIGDKTVVKWDGATGAGYDNAIHFSPKSYMTVGAGAVETEFYNLSLNLVRYWHTFGFIFSLATVINLIEIAI